MTKVVSYFDSSVILSMLLHDSNAERALDLWAKAEVKFASRLLMFESVVVVNRYSLKLPVGVQKNFRKESLSWLQKIYDQMYIHELDSSVHEMLIEEPKLATARTLDALHLATALLIKQHSKNLTVSTFDARMQALAGELGFSAGS